jgi:hypothetical protein
MKFDDIKNRFEELEYLNVGTIRDINLNKIIYLQLSNLRNELMSSHFKFNSIDEYDDAELLKLRIQEELLFCKMNIRDFKGLPIFDLMNELDELYSNNGNKYTS